MRDYWKGYGLPKSIIGFTFGYDRYYKLSLRDVSKILFKQRVRVIYEIIRRLIKTWKLVDRKEEEIENLLPKRRHEKASVGFAKKKLHILRSVSCIMVTNKPRSYNKIHQDTLKPSKSRSHKKLLNTKENFDQSMQGNKIHSKTFTSITSVQRFFFAMGVILNIFVSSCPPASCMEQDYEAKQETEGETKYPTHPLTPTHRKSFDFKLYDLNHDKVIDEESGNSSYVKYAFWGEEKFDLPQLFIDHTQKIIKREADLRRQGTIAASSNIVQFCFYGFYNNGESKIFEDMPFSDCQGVFYLSGNEPISYGNSSGKSQNFFNTQGISLNGKGARIIQRAQPIVRSIEATLSHLSKADDYITGSSPEIKSLIQQAKRKSTEVEEFRKNQKEIERQLTEISNEDLNPSEALSKNTLWPEAKLFMNNFIKEIKTSIEKDDFNFILLGETKNHPIVDSFLRTIKNKFSKRKLADLLNSQYFNLGCSEQLLLYYFGERSKRDLLSRKVIEELKKDSLTSIWLQIHTTKTPCKACLLSCCGHLVEEGGWIHSLFNQIRQKTSVPIYLIVSYHQSYKDEKGYGFSVPMIRAIPEDNQLLLIDTQRLFKVKYGEELDIN